MIFWTEKEELELEMVLLTALGVGGATVFGAVLGFAFKKISHKFSDIVLAFAAGVMLAAAVIGLVLPSLEYGGENGLPVTVVGILCGALCLNLIDKLVPHLHRLSGADQEAHPEQAAQLNKVLLFVMAIATSIDAMAVGVSFAFLQVKIIPAVTFIGVITFICSGLGVKIGSIFGSKYKSKAELAGGIVLILMGTKTLLEGLGVL